MFYIASKLFKLYLSSANHVFFREENYEAPAVTEDLLIHQIRLTLFNIFRVVSYQDYLRFMMKILQHCAFC